MRVLQYRWHPRLGWADDRPEATSDATLVLAFGSMSVLEDPGWIASLRRAFPVAQLLGCSTAGEVAGTRIGDGGAVVTAVTFKAACTSAAIERLPRGADPFAVGIRLASSIPRADLRHLFVLSTGLAVNGSALARGLAAALPPGIGVSGGLAGDGSAFRRTGVLLNAPALDDAVAVVGLHGRRLRVRCGIGGGWDPFGPERLITRSCGNTLYDLDGQPALDLYRQYLGDQADGLPATGLRFPLSLRINGDDAAVVRTVLSVDAQRRSMTFAGDVPEGAVARLMKANNERLLDGATAAARCASEPMRPARGIALLVSCVGRRLVLGQRAEEELDAVRSALGPCMHLAGFYSYGEIAPSSASAECQLHNQTMTCTVVTEDA